MLEIDGLIGLQHLFCYKAHSYQTMAKYDCPGAVHVNVKDKHRSSPVAWVCCMGQHCDHNLWLDSLFHSSLAALGAILWSLLSQLATVSLKMSIHLHKSSCIQMLWLTGKHISSGQPYYLSIHLGKETSAHLGFFSVYEYLIDSWRGTFCFNIGLLLCRTLRVFAWS